MYLYLFNYIIYVIKKYYYILLMSYDVPIMIKLNISI